MHCGDAASTERSKGTDSCTAGEWMSRESYQTSYHVVSGDQRPHWNPLVAVAQCTFSHMCSGAAKGCDCRSKPSSLVIGGTLDR